MASLDQVAGVLSDPIRLRILDLLAAGRDAGCCSPANPETGTALCACDLRPQLADIAPSKLSYHLKELKRVVLIQEKKRGKWIYYSLNHRALAEFSTAISRRFLGGVERGQTPGLPPGLFAITLDTSLAVPGRSHAPPPSATCES